MVEEVTNVLRVSLSNIVVRITMETIFHQSSGEMFLIEADNPLGEVTIFLAIVRSLQKKVVTVVDPKSKIAMVSNIRTGLKKVTDPILGMIKEHTNNYKLTRNKLQFLIMDLTRIRKENITSRLSVSISTPGLQMRKNHFMIFLPTLFQDTR